jgi:hypothetical protein
MLTSAPPTYDLLREHVEALIEAGEPFESVESLIDACRLPDDHKSALWLFAWSLSEGDFAPRPPRRALHVVEN